MSKTVVQSPPTKTIRIAAALHDRIQKFCDARHLKLNRTIEAKLERLFPVNGK